MAQKLGAGVLEVLNIDGETGHCSCRHGHVDDTQHPALASDDRGLHSRDDPARFLSLPSGRRRAVFALRIDQLETPFDDFRGVFAFDGVNERTVHQAQLQIRAAIPHREWSSFDEMRERVECAFGLTKA